MGSQYNAMMMMGRRRMGQLGWWGVGLLAAATVYVGGCAAQDQHRPFFHDDDKDMQEFSGARLGDSWEDDSVADFLRPEERAALRESGTAALRADDLDEPDSEASEAVPDESKGGITGALDKAGKVAVSALGVGISIGMVVAPYFLF